MQPVRICVKRSNGSGSGIGTCVGAAFGGLVSPRIPFSIESPARGAFPLRFGRQAFAGPFAVGVGFGPVDIVNRQPLLTLGDLSTRPVPGLRGAHGVGEASIV